MRNLPLAAIDILVVWGTLLWMMLAVQTNYEVEEGFAEFRIDGRCGSPPPWLDVQFIVRGDVMPGKR